MFGVINFPCSLLSYFTCIVCVEWHKCCIQAISQNTYTQYWGLNSAVWSNIQKLNKIKCMDIWIMPDYFLQCCNWYLFLSLFLTNCLNVTSVLPYFAVMLFNLQPGLLMLLCLLKANAEILWCRVFGKPPNNLLMYS